MKKVLLLASALTGFAVVAQAQEATTVKTTTVQYQVPTCTNCRTTTTTSTTYPEPEQVCETCVQPVVAQPVAMKRKEKKKIICHDNHDLGIRNPLFTLREGQLSIQEVDGVYREPKRKTHLPNGGKDDRVENRGWDAHGTVVYGITDDWSVKLFGGKEYTIPKTDQYRNMLEEQYGRRGPVLHMSGYTANIETDYHVLDLCHLDVIDGLQASWHREKSKEGEHIRRVNGWGWAPTLTVGSNWGWFTPYVSAAYQWDHTKDWTDTTYTTKHWVRSHGWYVNPGIYIQPSKWYAFDFNVQKQEERDAFWHLGVDFYPYKNWVFGIQGNARRPFRHPMHMQGVAAVAKVVF